MKGDETMKMLKFEEFLNDEERKDVEEWIQRLEKDKEKKVGDFIESGGLGVRRDDIDGYGRFYVVYRIVATTYIEPKKK